MTFEDLLKNWTTDISALRETMSLAQILNIELLKDKNKEMKEFITSKCNILEKKSESDFTYEIPDSVYTTHVSKKKEINNFTVACSIFPRMFIVTLLCQYDALIGNLVKLVLENKPEILIGSERTFTFQQISSFNSIADAKNALIAKEVESLLRKSHDEQLKWFENKLGIILHGDEKLIKNFIEITERRNLYTHNNGIVNESYLSNCKHYNISTDAKIGDILKVTPGYFNNASNCLLEIGIKLTVIIWRTILVSEKERSEIVTNQIAYGFISDGRYDFALKILDFCLSCFKTFVSASNKLMINMNKAQCLLWMKQEENAKKLLDAQDWSLCTPQFIVCKKVLERKFDEAVEILRNQDTQLDQKDLLSWPIFKELREQEIFINYCNEKYPTTVKEYSEEIPNNVVEAEEQLKKESY